MLAKILVTGRKAQLVDSEGGVLLSFEALSPCVAAIAQIYEKVYPDKSRFRLSRCENFSKYEGVMYELTYDVPVTNLLQTYQAYRVNEHPMVLEIEEQLRAIQKMHESTITQSTILDTEQYDRAVEELEMILDVLGEQEGS